MTALLARVYLYKGDKTKALECAKEVIDGEKFTLLEESQLGDGNTWGSLCSEMNTYLLCMCMIWKRGVRMCILEKRVPYNVIFLILAGPVCLELPAWI